MSDLSLTILAETANDAQAIERLHERTFGPGRFVLSAYRLREHVDHLLDLSFTARIGTLLVGSVRQLPICIGETPALMLGPLTVEPPFRDRGVGRALLDRALKDAKAKDHRLVVLVGDEAYYSRVGFKPVPKGRATMPGPVDYSRLLVAEHDRAFFVMAGLVPAIHVFCLGEARRGCPAQGQGCPVEQKWLWGLRKTRIDGGQRLFRLAFSPRQKSSSPPAAGPRSRK